ncbi:MAG: membrane protein FxsA [Hyphomicrobiales bacterium]|nr:membrane protein FxsA [Hyphomicrobiales bacterium]
MPFTFLPFVLLIVPIMEIAVFVVVGGKIGALWTIGLVLLTAVMGSILLRIEGFRTFVQIRDKLNAGQIPGEELAKGAMILVAGVLLLTPGFITDGIGFALFMPFVRKLIWVFLANRIVVNQAGGFKPTGFDSEENTAPDIVDLDPDEFHEDPNKHSPWYSDHKDDKQIR